MKERVERLEQALKEANLALAKAKEVGDEPLVTVLQRHIRLLEKALDDLQS